MKSYKDKQLLLGLLFLGVAAGITGHSFETLLTKSLGANSTANLNPATALLATQTNLASKYPPPPEITLGFVGDIMTDRDVRESVNENFDGDYAKLFANAGFLKQPDITFANLEGPVSDKGTDQSNPSSVRMDPATIPALVKAGIDIVSVANDHEADWGRLAYEDTLTRLRATGILTCGGGMNKKEAETPAIIDQGGFTVGFLCFSDVGPDNMAATDTQSGVLLASDPNFDAIVRSAAAQVSSLIVSFYFGSGNQTVHTARQQQLADEAINDGAIMVVGDNPNTPEDITQHDNGAPIIYSLGNFISDQKFSANTPSGIYLTATLNGKTVSDVTPHETTQDANFAPSLE